MVRTNRNVFFICIFLLALFLTPSLAFSLNEVEVTLPSKDMSINAGETNEVYVTVKNNQNVEDVFSISIFPSISFINHITVTLDGYLATLEAGSETTMKITFNAPECSKGMETTESFQVTAKSTSDSNVNDTKTMILAVKGKGPVCISDIIPNKYSFDPGEAMIIEVVLKNVADTASFQYGMQTNVKKDGKIIERFDEDVISIPAGGTRTITQSYTFDKYDMSGDYYIDVLLKDSLGNVLNSREIDNPVTLDAVFNIKHEKSVSYGLLLQTITIKVKNEGNAPATTFYVTEDMPTFMQSFVQPMQMVTTNVTFDRIYYHWFIDSLLPGEERIISYQINLWGAWGFAAILIIIIIIAFRIVYGPGIIKRFRHFGSLTRGKEVLISLEVRNRSMHTIKDVVVKDFVPPIVGVVQRFDTLKPAIKRSRRGTEVIWKFNSLRPREERVLTYRIKPVVDIEGILKLPKAKMTYTDRKKRRKASISKSIIVKPK